MTNEFIEEKFKELIYDFGEIDFNIIKNESWDEYINEGKKFNEKQIKYFREFIKDFLDDLTDKRE